MRVLLLPTEFAGQVNLSAQGLREIGLNAYNTARPLPFDFPIDIDPRITWLPFLKNTRDPFLFYKWANEFDLFHYNKSPYLPMGIDVKLLQKKQKPFVIEFWGSDIRLDNLEKLRNPYFVSDNATNQERKINRLKFWASQTDEVIFSDHSADIFLQPYFKKIHVVGQRVDTNRYNPNYPSPQNKKPRIVHAPSIKATKGTQFVTSAIERLKKSGLDFDYIEVSGVCHKDAVQIYSEADIIIDQLMMGSHGVFACEAMALGKPVICYILDELLSTYPPGFPIINANPDTIAAVLEEMICSPEKRYEIGKKSRKYAEEVHDIRVVAKKLQAIYNDALLRKTNQHF
jgi:glycosyltransferase involved in cell wall biosynthesis